MLHVSSPAVLREKFRLTIDKDFPDVVGGLKESFANFGLIPYGH